MKEERFFLHAKNLEDTKKVEKNKNEDIVIEPISEKEKFLKKVQDPEYYGDPLEAPKSRERYHAWGNDPYEPEEKKKEEKEEKEIVENVTDIIPKKKRHNDTIIFADLEDKIVGLSEDFARNETSQKKKGKGLFGAVKNFFGNMVGYDVKFAHQRSIAEKKIYESGNLFVNSENGGEVESSEKEKQAVLRRLNNNFLLEGESIEDLDEDVGKSVKDSIAKYVFDMSNSSEEEFKESVATAIESIFDKELEANKKLAKSFKVDLKNILLTKYASNVFKLAKKIKNESKDLIISDRQLILDRIYKIKIKKASILGGQLTTEKLGKVEGAIDKILRKVPIIGALDYIAISVGTMFATTFAKTTATAVTGGVGGIVLGSTLAGVKESRKIEKDRAQVSREAAIGYEEANYDKKMKDLKAVAEFHLEALIKENKVDEFTNRMKDLKIIDVSEKDTFVDLYLKISRFDGRVSKEVEKIIKDIINISKKYYNDRNTGDYDERQEKYLKYKDLVDEINKIKSESRVRENMRQFVYEQRHVEDLNECLKIDNKEFEVNKFRFAFGNLLDATVRQKMSAVYRIDLIEYSDRDKVEAERGLLALHIASSRSKLKKMYLGLSEEDKKNVFGDEYENIKDKKNFDALVEGYVNKKIQNFNEQKGLMDDAFGKYKRKESIKRGLVTAGMSIVGCLAAQELKAAFDDKLYGFVERMFDKGKGASSSTKQTMLDYLAGGLLKKQTITTTDNFNQACRIFDGAIGKDGVKIEQVFDRGGLHMDNNTANYDLNELKLDIFKNGNNVVASMKRMISGGSFRGNISLNPGDKNLVYKLLISLSDGSKGTPISIPFGPDGNIIIPESLKFLFGSNGQLLAKYAEVAACDQSGNILGILATSIGAGISGSSVVNTVAQFANPSFFGLMIPTYRKPLERAEKYEHKIKKVERKKPIKKTPGKKPVIEPENIVDIVETTDILGPVEVAQVIEPETVVEAVETVQPEQTTQPEQVVSAEEISKVEKTADIKEDAESSSTTTKTTTPKQENMINSMVMGVLDEFKKYEKPEKVEFTDKDESLKNIQMFRAATFILKKYGDKDKIEKIMKIKNKQEKMDALRNIMLESWHELTLHDDEDLDCYGVRFILEAAGFKIHRIGKVPKGDLNNRGVRSDVGGVDGFETGRHVVDRSKEGMANEIAYDYAVLGDHHGEKSERYSSSSSHLYNFVTRLGFVDDRTGYLKSIVAFITREDNKNYQYGPRRYAESRNTLFGVKKFLTNENLIKLLNNQEIKNRFLSEVEKNKETRAEDSYNIEFMHLSDKELMDIGLTPEILKLAENDIKKGIYGFSMIERENKELEKNKSEKKLMYNFDDKKIILNPEYHVKNLVDVSIANGYNIIVSYSVNKDLFSASFIDKVPDFSPDFINKMKKYGLMQVRGLIIKDKNGKKTKPIDDDLIYGPGGLINELKNN